MGVDNAGGNISVGFSITVQDVEPLLQALQSGGAYEVRCLGRLYRHRVGMWNSLLGEAVYTCQLAGRPIARECVVTDARGEHVLSFNDLRRDLGLLWQRLSMPMGSWDMIERNNDYRVQLVFKVVQTNVPGWVAKPLFFVNWELVPEMTYEFAFDY